MVLERLSGLALGLLILGIAATAACAEPPAAAGKEPAFTKVEFLRTGGIAGLFITMTIDGSGQVRVLTGPPDSQRERALPEGKKHLEPKELAKLGELIKGVDWAKIKPAYKSSQPVADGFHYSLTVIRGGKTYKTGIDDPIDIPVPKPLVVLRRYLGELESKYGR